MSYAAISISIYTAAGTAACRRITGEEIVSVVEQIAKRSAYVAHRSFEILNKTFRHGLAKQLRRAIPATD